MPRGLTRTCTGLYPFLTRTGTCARIYTAIWVWAEYGDAQTRIPVDPKKIEKYHTGTGIPIPYPGPWRVRSGSKILYPEGYGSRSGSKFNYKGTDLGLGVP
ncbi:hypothetical protein M9H77_07700 [Catharanthus roseus]|uniref:Uncharacterized protein n=1 Tax=Catharanthus roseus TaxID=4058 RepID=A0ACC0BVQ8_CATRO|nr:hypothetical protein M9H77_07700 [Catharanthus roseus]